MPNIQVNGTTLYYETHGSGMPIVFIHGHLSTHHMFDPQVEYFSKRAKVIVLDLRGYGNSGKLNVEVEDIIDTQCKDLSELLEKLDIPKITLVGCSSGSLLVQKFAASHPDRVNALVLVDSYFYGPYGPFGTKNSIWKIFEACSWLSYYLPAEFFLRSLRVTYNRWVPAYSILRDELFHKRPTESIKQRMALLKTDVDSNSSRLRMPILCVAGRQSEWFVKQMNKAAERFACAQKAVIEDAIYPSHLCQPQQFNRVLLDFLIDQRIFRMEKQLV
ncbi:alpha/beta hydrolase [Paenibacillus dokdonensis]|uniref:Alpha/beta hydrolase n=1 Tax=Paenibacillus dokdonensis TaxID=2567944 RepID=A0ABU6GL20_9BACL|nr:alpha/beta hydrolase [Paenibacillus dokdonensis]MEC0238852.1 alpha/beta hydrolase [Paenibacillus dokdonensis]